MSSRAVSPVFAGREAELTVLASAFGDAADGLPRMVLVGAEAGGGKSRLGVTRLELPRLSRSQVGAQLEGILRRPPGPAITSAVYERGNGIPLFTEALVNADGTVSLGVPWSLRDQLLGAVKELPEQTQQVLRSAAAGGGIRVGHGLLAAVTGFDDLALAATLRRAVAANVVAADADGYAFRHQLIREAVWEDLLRACSPDRSGTCKRHCAWLTARPVSAPRYWASSAGR